MARLNLPPGEHAPNWRAAPETLPVALLLCLVGLFAVACAINPAGKAARVARLVRRRVETLLDDTWIR